MTAMAALVFSPFSNQFLIVNENAVYSYMLIWYLTILLSILTFGFWHFSAHRNSFYFLLYTCYVFFPFIFLESAISPWAHSFYCILSISVDGRISLYSSGIVLGT